MSQASLIINVSDREQVHSNGLSGSWIVPAKKANEEFALLVVYPTPEIQDIGDQRRVMHWLKAAPLAKDIIGLRSDAAAHGQGVSGTKEKWGLLLCEAEPDVPREMIKIIETEIEFLNDNLPDYKFRKHKETGAVVATNVEPESITKERFKLSKAVVKARAEFEADCRKLVQKSEILRARKALTTECQRLVAEGDRMWARPTEQQNISELHRWGCALLGQERPWCYIPQQLVDCPGCGAKIKENVLSCAHCAGWLDEGIEELRVMPAKERAQKMYPDRYAEPVGASGKPAART